MPSLNKTITNQEENHNEFPLDLLTLIIPIGILIILFCIVCIQSCYYEYKYPFFGRRRGRRISDSISSMSSDLSYPTFVSKPKPNIFFIKDMKQYNVQEALDMKDICSICIEAYDEGDKVVTMPCKHEFHKICIRPWLRNQINTNTVPLCPMCKKELIVEYRLEIQETDKGVIIEKI